VQSWMTATAGAQRGAAEGRRSMMAAEERRSKTAVKKGAAAESPRIVRQQLIQTADDQSPLRQSVQAEVHRSFVEDSGGDEAAKGISKMKYGRRKTSGYFSRSDHISPRRYKLISVSDSENEVELKQYESEGRRSDKNQPTFRSVSNRRSDSNEVPSRSEKLHRRSGRYRSLSPSDTEVRSVEPRRRWKDDQSDHEVIANQSISKPRVKSVIVVPEVKVQKPKYAEVEPKHAEAKSDRHRHRSSNRHRRRRHTSDSSSSDETQNSYRRHKIRPRTFDGFGSFETFWVHCENCAAYNRWTEADQLAHLKASPTGDAGQVLWDSDAAATDTLAKLTALLRGRYSGSRQADKYRMELRLRK